MLVCCGKRTWCRLGTEFPQCIICIKEVFVSVAKLFLWKRIQVHNMLHNLCECMQLYSNILTSGKVLDSRIHSLFPFFIEDHSMQHLIDLQRRQYWMPVVLLQATNMTVEDALLDPSADASYGTDVLKCAEALVVSGKVLSAALAYLNSFHLQFVYFPTVFQIKRTTIQTFPPVALTCGDPYHF